ncbi:MAG TPA: Sec-independent protein translocase protein TatB [Aquabacterium sp.]|nr:Sec-independent protein translocase protein TatB [Aquabacterium sp.]
MIDFGFDKLALIGAVALIVIGPERLPKVARTVGVLLGKAQRYVAQVQSEVNRSIELEELKKMQTGIQDAARSVEQTVRHELQEAESALAGGGAGGHDTPYSGADFSSEGHHTPYYASQPAARKNWRLKRGATPLWYKQHTGVRRHVQSGAARVARFRPPTGPR